MRVTVCFVALLLAACGAPSDNSSNAPSEDAVISEMAANSDDPPDWSGNDPRIEDRRWLLIEIEGSAYKTTGNPQAFISLESAASQANGNNSCNNFFGGYTLEAGEQIRFSSNMGATMMACPDMETEAAFMQALQGVDAYSVSGDQLSLHGAGKPLLRFELGTEENGSPG